MVNKTNWLKVSLFVTSILWLSLSFVSAASFRVNLWIAEQALSEDALASNIMPIHFADHWNDFGWFFYFSDTVEIDHEPSVECRWDLEDIRGECLQFENGERYICQAQVTWFYYNSERWERLWPIDKMTATSLQNHNLQPWLTTEGWLYTRCMSAELAQEIQSCIQSETEEEDPEWEPDEDEESEPFDEEQCEMDAWSRYGNMYGYYGMIEHQYAWKNFGLIAGVQYSLDEDIWWLFINNSGLAETFTRFDNKYPVGLVYDYNGWVWLVWCETSEPKTESLRNFVEKLNAWSGLNDLFRINADEEYLEYVVDGVEDSSLNCHNIGVDPNSLINLIVEWLVWMWRRSDLDIIWNQTNQKMQFFKSVDVDDTALINYAKKKAEALCRWKWVDYNGTNMPNGTLRCINANNQTIVAQTWVTYVVKNWNVRVAAMSQYGNDSNYYDVYIVSNWNLLLDNITDANMKKVITTGGFISTMTRAQYQSQIASQLQNYDWYEVAVWAFIKGNFVVDWNLQSTDGNKISNRYFVYWKFTTKDTLKTLQELFSWYCRNGISSDDHEKYCPQSKKWWWKNPYDNAFLVVIDQNYHSQLLNY